MARPRNLTLCSFCGKSHAEVRKLVSGPGVYICDGCVEIKTVLEQTIASVTHPMKEEEVESADEEGEDFIDGERRNHSR